MRRREFITLVGGAAFAWPLAVGAQQAERLARIGYLSLTSPPLNAYDDAFLAGLRDLSYVEGKNLHIEFRFTEGQEDRLARLATELVDLNVDVIVTYPTGVYAAKRATATIPIVMETTGDLVAMGVVASLAHPGGNITGQTFFYPELMAKRLELLKVEFRAGADGETPFPIEYKRGKPKRHRADEVQLCAQALCLEEMTGLRVPEGALFYGETKRRVLVPFDSELRRLTEDTAVVFGALVAEGRTPSPIYRADRCRACSLIEICRPKAMRKSALAFRQRGVAATLDPPGDEAAR